MSSRFFFGYGSLVNRYTHEFTGVARASASGWRRAWRFARSRQVSFLTVIPDPECTIHGLVAAVPDQDWAALDHRERAYDRLPADDCVSHDGPGDASVAIYAIRAEHLNEPDADHPVLLSYLDVVIEGYLREYGAEGPRHFLETTTGWTAPILDDRAAPRYPRHRRLSPDTRDAVETVLRETGARLMVG